jgi:hypothetical protein
MSVMEGLNAATYVQQLVNTWSKRLSEFQFVESYRSDSSFGVIHFVFTEEEFGTFHLIFNKERKTLSVFLSKWVCEFGFYNKPLSFDIQFMSWIAQGNYKYVATKASNCHGSEDIWTPVYEVMLHELNEIKRSAVKILLAKENHDFKDSHIYENKVLLELETDIENINYDNYLDYYLKYRHTDFPKREKDPTFGSVPREKVIACWCAVRRAYHLVCEREGLRHEW